MCRAATPAHLYGDYLRGSTTDELAARLDATQTYRVAIDAAYHGQRDNLAKLLDAGAR